MLIKHVFKKHRRLVEMQVLYWCAVWPWYGSCLRRYNLRMPAINTLSRARSTLPLRSSPSNSDDSSRITLSHPRPIQTLSRHTFHQNVVCQRVFNGGALLLLLLQLHTELIVCVGSVAVTAAVISAAAGRATRAPSTVVRRCRGDDPS